MENGKIEITRTQQYANSLRRIKIYIDDKEEYLISDGESKLFELEVGIHEIYVKIDWCKTKPIKIEIKKNETLEFTLGSNVSGWKLIFLIFYITFMTNDFLYLRKK